MEDTSPLSNVEKEAPRKEEENVTVTSELVRIDGYLDMKRGPIPVTVSSPSISSQVEEESVSSLSSSDEEEEEEDPEEEYESLCDKIVSNFQDIADWTYNNRKDSVREKADYLTRMADEMDELGDQLREVMKVLLEKDEHADVYRAKRLLLQIETSS
jgi:hypothetical protein